ncbi:putative MFS-type transporter C09D4.1 [Clavelina lepadiformis]|uniref:putative MFS-type transporter C09D4.1 n=1 Tax=Clavelina lepadiformis TaxID=159417 RepID=UPI004042E43D
MTATITQASQESETRIETALSAKRWLILFLLTTTAAQSFFMEMSFGIVNDIYVYYFNISYAEADWVVTGAYAGMLSTAPIMAWLTYKRYIALRLTAIIHALSILLNTLFIVIAVAARTSYALVMVGQFFNGISRLLLFSLFSTLAVLWFPDSQVGTAMGLYIGGCNVGGILGSILPGYLLEPVPKFNNGTGNRTDIVLNPAVFDWMAHNRLTMLAMYSSMLALSIIVLVLTWLLVTDLPPKPPTLAQAAKRRQLVEVEHSLDGSFLSECKKLFSERGFVGITIIAGFVGRAYGVELAMMSEMLRGIYSDDSFDLNPDLLGGFLTGLFNVGCIAGNIIGAKLLNNWKNYKILITVGSFLSWLAFTSLLLSFALKQYAAISIATVLFSIPMRISILVSYEIATQETYPMDELFVNLWFTGGQAVVGIVVLELCRVFYDNISALAVLAFQAVVLLVAVLLSFMLRLQNRRLNVERKFGQASMNGETEATETTPLN